MDKKIKKYLRAAGRKGADARWAKRTAKRMKVITKLRAFGGIQPNYRLWTIKQLKDLLRAWESIKQ